MVGSIRLGVFVSSKRGLIIKDGAFKKTMQPLEAAKNAVLAEKKSTGVQLIPQNSYYLDRDISNLYEARRNTVPSPYPHLGDPFITDYQDGRIDDQGIDNLKLSLSFEKKINNNKIIKNISFGVAGSILPVTEISVNSTVLAKEVKQLPINEDAAYYSGYVDSYNSSYTLKSIEYPGIFFKLSPFTRLVNLSLNYNVESIQHTAEGFYGKTKLFYGSGSPSENYFDKGATLTKNLKEIYHNIEIGIGFNTALDSRNSLCNLHAGLYYLLAGAREYHDHFRASIGVSIHISKTGK